MNEAFLATLAVTHLISGMQTLALRERPKVTEELVREHDRLFLDNDEALIKAGDINCARTWSKAKEDWNYRKINSDPVTTRRRHQQNQRLQGR